MRKTMIRLLPFGMLLLLFVATPWLAAQSKEQEIQAEIKDWYELYSDIIEGRGPEFAQEEKAQLEQTVRRWYAREIKQRGLWLRIGTVLAAGAYGFVLWGIPAWRKCAYARRKRILFLLMALFCAGALLLFFCASQAALFVRGERVKNAETETTGDVIFQSLYIQLEEQDGFDSLESFFQVAINGEKAENAASPLMEKYWGPEYLNRVEFTLRGISGAVLLLAGGGMWLLSRKGKTEEPLES